MEWLPCLRGILLILSILSEISKPVLRPIKSLSLPSSRIN